MLVFGLKIESLWLNCLNWSLLCLGSYKEMDFKALKFQILSGSIARRVLLRAFMIASALSIVPLLQNFSGTNPGLFDSINFRECDVNFMFAGSDLLKNRIFKPIWDSFECKKDVNLTTNVARELMRMELLDYSANALCLGEGSGSAVYALRELGFHNACGVYRHPFFSLRQRKLVYELGYPDNSFDFVLSRDLDKVSVPALLVLEIERILKPGGIGAMLVGGADSNSNNLIRSATPISSLLKTSSIVHVGYVQNFTLVVFKKRIYSAGYFEQFRLPADCPAVMNNSPFIEHMEPLVENKEAGFDKQISYLPSFVDMASRKRLVYVDIGAGDDLNSSVTDSFLASYPVDRKAFNIYFVDHNTSVLFSCVKKPGVTFIYYPGLAGEKAAATQNSEVEDLDPSVEDEGFDFLAWFVETVQYADFVVLKMKAGVVELKFLTDLFKSGSICYVDELFLNCSNHPDGKNAENGDCRDMLQSLRSSGVFVHQWWGE